MVNKRFWFLLLSVASLFVLCGCGDSGGNQKDCVGEGEQRSSKSGAGPCCHGLVATRKMERRDGVCQHITPPDLQICMACGNGKCDSQYGENDCTCEKDCKKAEEKGCVGEGEQRSSKSGAGPCCRGLVATRKMERKDGVCQHITPPDLQICMACGNGKCDSQYGENDCTCEKDCKP